jgi:hypothetical protein
MGAEMLRFALLSMTNQVQENYDDELSNLVLPHA